jgi:hypothetical protein
MNRESGWVIIKNGSFYGPDHKGYTSSISEAGLYTQEDAQSSEAHCEGCKALPYLIAMHGTDNIRFDFRRELFWHTTTFAAWGRDQCSIKGYMVQHRAMPEVDYSARTPIAPTDDPSKVVFIPPAITADAVRIYRDATGMGMHEAKRDLKRAGYETAMNRFKADATMEDKVDFILDWITDKEMGRA